MNKYKHLLFDMDETLLDFSQAEKLAFYQLMDELNITNKERLYSIFSPLNLSLWKKLEKNEITKPELFATRFGTILNEANTSGDLPVGVELPSIQEVNSLYMTFIASCGITFPGAVELLTKLKATGLYDLCIITNGTTFSANGRLNASGLRPLIDEVFISDEIGVNKPSALFFDKVKDCIGDFDCQHYLVIGDSLTSDIQGAISANMDAVLITHHGEFPENTQNYAIKYTAKSFDDVYNIVTNA